MNKLLPILFLIFWGLVQHANAQVNGNTWVGDLNLTSQMQLDGIAQTLKDLGVTTIDGNLNIQDGTQSEADPITSFAALELELVTGQLRITSNFVKEVTDLQITKVGRFQILNAIRLERFKLQGEIENRRLNIVQVPNLVSIDIPTELKESVEHFNLKFANIITELPQNLHLKSIEIVGVKITELPIFTGIGKMSLINITNTRIQNLKNKNSKSLPATEEIDLRFNPQLETLEGFPVSEDSVKAIIRRNPKLSLCCVLLDANLTDDSDINLNAEGCDNLQDVQESCRTEGECDYHQSPPIKEDNSQIIEENDSIKGQAFSYDLVEIEEHSLDKKTHLNDVISNIFSNVKTTQNFTSLTSSSFKIQKSEGSTALLLLNLSINGFHWKLETALNKISHDGNAFYVGKGKLILEENKSLSFDLDNITLVHQKEAKALNLKFDWKYQTQHGSEELHLKTEKEFEDYSATAIECAKMKGFYFWEIQNNNAFQSIEVINALGRKFQIGVGEKLSVYTKSSEINILKNDQIETHSHNYIHGNQNCTEQETISLHDFDWDHSLPILQAKHTTVTVYPNPNKGTFTLKNNFKFPIKVEIIAPDSKKVYQHKIEGESAEVLDLSHIKKGIYLIMSESEEGVNHQKIVIH